MLTIPKMFVHFPYRHVSALNYALHRLWSMLAKINFFLRAVICTADSEAIRMWEIYKCII